MSQQASPPLREGVTRAGASHRSQDSIRTAVTMLLARKHNGQDFRTCSYFESRFRSSESRKYLEFPVIRGFFPQVFPKLNLFPEPAA